MENRYLYRGKRKDNGEWTEGNLLKRWDGLWIFTIDEKFADLIIPSTICQCTAMPDKNGKIAYEHDIIKTPVGNAEIIWNCSPSPIDNHINVGFEVVFLDAIANDNYRHDLGYWIGKSEVIGNIFDNTELLEV